MGALPWTGEGASRFNPCCLRLAKKPIDIIAGLFLARVLEDVFGAANLDDFACVKKRGALRNVLRLLRIVRDDDDGVRLAQFTES